MGNDPTAILTNGQRQYLRGEGEVGQQRTTDHRIRKRVATAIVEDATLLNEHVSAEKVAKNEQPSELAEGVRSMVAFCFRLCDAAGVDPKGVIEDGVHRVREERLERIFEKLTGADERVVTVDEVRTLNEHGYLDEDAYSTLFKRWMNQRGQLTVGDILEVNPTLAHQE